MTSPTSTSSLTSWAQSSFSSLYERRANDSVATEADFLHAFNDVLSTSCEITVNGAVVSRDSLVQTISQRNFASVESTVEWSNIIEVPASTEDTCEAGIVAGFAIVTRSSKIRIRAGPAQTQTFMVINAKIEQDPTTEVDGNDDRRRIVNLFMTALDKAVPVRFHNLGGAGSAE